MDVGEVFKPGQWTEPFVFPVGNPTDRPLDIQLAAIGHLPEWQASSDADVAANVPPRRD